MVQLIDRQSLKRQSRELVRDAQVSAKSMTALFLSLVLILDMATVLCEKPEVLSTFLSFLSALSAAVLSAGFAMYCMGIRRGERVEYLALFDGFSFAGKIIVTNLLIGVLTGLGATFFIVPGILIYYRFRFALFHLYENPELGILEAMQQSARELRGYKYQLFQLDITYLGWSILGALPSLVYSGLLYGQAFQLATAYIQNPVGVMPAVDPATLLLPGWAWTLLSGLWSLAVSLFYLPQRRCTELAFFEAVRANPMEEPPSLPEF